MVLMDNRELQAHTAHKEKTGIDGQLVHKVSKVQLERWSPQVHKAKAGQDRVFRSNRRHGSNRSDWSQRTELMDRTEHRSYWSSRSRWCRWYSRSNRSYRTNRSNWNKTEIDGGCTGDNVGPTGPTGSDGIACWDRKW